MAALAQKGIIFADKKVHAVVYEPCRLARDHGAQLVSFPHQNITELRRMLSEYKGEGPRIIAIDGVYSISAEKAPITEYQQLCEEFSLLLLRDLFIRAHDLTAHYTDNGILPRAIALAENPNFFGYFPHFWSGSETWIGVLFIIASAAAIALLIGWKTRWMTILSWFLLCSIQTRNEGVNYGADYLLRLLLFWAMFISLNQSGEDNDRRKDYSVFILGQVCLMYLFSALLKIVSGSAWYPDGIAIQTALSNPLLASDLGRSLLLFPHVLKIATYMSLCLELVGPFLLFFLPSSSRARDLTLISFFLLHLGILLFQRVGYFPMVAFVALALFIPGRAWDFLKIPVKIKNLKSEMSSKINPFAGPIATICMATVIIWNCYGVIGRIDHRISAPAFLKTVVMKSRLDQTWSMFASPSSSTKWYKIFAYNGSDKYEAWEKAGRKNSPDGFDPQGIYSDERWTTYLMYPAEPFGGEFTSEKSPFVKYVCKNLTNRQIASVQTPDSIEIEYFWTDPDNGGAYSKSLGKEPCS
jgi:hypothetical protein